MRDIGRAAALAAAVAASAILAARGEWAGFGGWLAGLPAGWKAWGYRWAFLSRWVPWMALAYALALSGGIFLGLRRVRRGGR